LIQRRLNIFLSKNAYNLKFKKKGFKNEIDVLLLGKILGIILAIF
jgi:hypothetical protein